MSKIGFISILLFTLLGSTSAFATMWGTGMYPAQQGCGFNPMMTDEIRGIKAEQEDIKESLKDIKDDIRRARTRSKTAERALADIKSRFQKHGLSGGAFNIIDRHISSGRSCDSYATEECPATRKRGGKPLSENDLKLDPIDALLALNGIGDTAPLRNVASTKVPPGKVPKEVEDSEDDYDIVAPPKNQPQQQRLPQDDGASVPDGEGEYDCGPSRGPTAPFTPGVWSQACQGSSVSGSFICRQGVDQGPNFNDRLCESLLRDWAEKKKDADEALAKVGELEGELSRLNIEKSDKAAEYKDAVKETREEYRRTLTEGGCIECMMQGQSYYQQQRKPNWLEVGGNLLLGIGSMYFGNQQQRYISDNNAKLGFPTQSYPAIGYGYPYFMNALYGAVGGGMSSGGFGCGGGIGGGMGGGGAFGYPNGMMGGPMGGGIFNGGFGPGALGYGNMMGGGYMMGGPMGGGYMMSGGMMMPGGGYMMPGYMMGGPMGGGMGMMMGGPGMMMPGAMMPGYMMNAYMGGPMGGGMGMMMGGPGMMMGGGMMMPGGGMMMPGYMMPGYMVGGGIGMMTGGMMPGYMMGGAAMMPGMMMGGMTGMMMPGAMGGGMSGMMMPGYMMSGMVPGSMMSMMPGAMGGGAMMGGMDPMAMQMQQMQMQLQMQQMQTMQQMQQRRMENYMAQSRVVSGLTMELNTLYSRLQQAQMSMYSGGSMGFEMGVSPYGTLGQYGTSAVPFYQGGVQGVGGIPGTIGAPTFR